MLCLHYLVNSVLTTDPNCLVLSRHPFTDTLFSLPLKRKFTLHEIKILETFRLEDGDDYEYEI